MTNPDSLQVVADVLRDHHDMHGLADRIERLDAELRKDSELVTYMLLCTNADDDPDDAKADRADTIWDGLGADRQDLARTFCLGVSHKAVQEANTELRARLAVCEKADPFADKYHELIMAVGRKYPGESRHATALRYIKERESRTCAGSDASDQAAQSSAKGVE